MILILLKVEALLMNPPIITQKFVEGFFRSGALALILDLLRLSCLFGLLMLEIHKITFFLSWASFYSNN